MTTNVSLSHATNRRPRGHANLAERAQDPAPKIGRSIARRPFPPRYSPKTIVEPIRIFFPVKGR